MGQPVEAITEHVQWERAFPPNTELTFNRALGFLALEGREMNDRVTVVGFYSPTPAGGEGLPTELTQATELSDIPKADRTIDLQGKGVGRRLYNTPHAAAGLAHEPWDIGAYAFQVNPRKILDTRSVSDQTLGGKAHRIMQHASRIVRSHIQGLEDVVDEIHASYKGYEAVIISQPPRAAQRQQARGMSSPVPPAFMLTRRKGEPLPLVGRIVNPWALQR